MGGGGDSQHERRTSDRYVGWSCVDYTLEIYEKKNVYSKNEIVVK